MLYAPALSRIRVNSVVWRGLALAALISLAPVFVVNAWPLAAAPALLLILWRPAIPARWVWGPALAIALAGLVAPPALAAGFWWVLLLLVLTVGTFQRLADGPIYDALIAGAAIHAVLGPSMITDGRLVGWLGNANLTGSLLAICLVLALARRRWLLAAIIAGGLAGTQSVGAILGSLAGIAWLAVTSRRGQQLIRGRPYRLGIVLLAAVILVALGASQRDTWLRWRPLQWATGIGMAYQAPILGMGPGSFAAAWSDVNARTFTHAHNFYIHMLAESGLAGVLGLAALAVGIAWRVRGPALAGLIVLAVHGLVDATALHLVIAWLAAALVGIGSPRRDLRGERAIRLAQNAAFLLAVLTPVAGWFVQLHYGG